MTFVHGSRSAFTAIEMTLVVTVMAILSGMTTQVVVSSLRTSAVNEAAASIEQAVVVATDHARRATLMRSVTLVLVDADGATPAYVALTYGTTASASKVWEQGGQAVYRTELPQGVRIIETADDGSVSLRTELGWMLDHNSARPMASISGAASMVYIGDSSLATSVVDPAGAVRLAGTVHIGSADGSVGVKLELLPSGQVHIR
jgi:type II secretory pathway pseudopilin PulG